MNEIELKNHYPNLQGGTLSPLVLTRVNDSPDNAYVRPALIVVPGGAYIMNSGREAEPVAARFLAKGFRPSSSIITALHKARSIRSRF